MGTYKQLVDRVALDYLNRYDLIPEVKRAINNAINCYATQRWWFNEAQTAVATSASASTLSIPSDFLALDRIEVFYSGGWSALREETHDVIRRMNAVSTTSQPTHFTYYQNRFELALVPDSAYNVTVYYLKSLPALSADADSNVWTTEGANAIAHAAALEVLGNVIVSTNHRLIERHERGLHRGLEELHYHNSLRMSTKLSPTSF